MTENNPVLLTVSGTIPPDIQAKIDSGQRPQADYLSMAAAFHADLVDFPGARRQTGWFGGLLEKLGGRPLVLAWACFLQRKKYRLIFTDGEQIGIPLAMMLKFLSFGARPIHFMITHILSVPKKMLFFDYFHVQTHIDRIFVYATRQKEFIQNRWNLEENKVVFTPFMVDHHFFSPQNARPGDPLGIKGPKPIVCSVGLEFRDYATLIEAVSGLDVTVVIAAASPWSRRKDTTQSMTLPANIIVKKFSQFDLRDLYAASSFMVMPLQPVEFQAGVTAILEAMSMEKTVICSHTPGQTDVIIAGENGIYVPPQDPVALRNAIMDLLNHPAKAASFGKNGRQQVLNRMSLEQYTKRLMNSIEGCL